MKTVGAYEAKTHLSRLLDETANGHRVAITRNGNPVAVLSPVPTARTRDRRMIVEQLREFRKGVTTGGGTIREMIEEGRRF
ncbi:MAG: type II toxin-antitoxin system Phd/YefM family antitoxin [bacterium]|nr:type II toxin-antitoxin system Phd/YefM family antitoxin [bacterium]